MPRCHGERVLWLVAAASVAAPGHHKWTVRRHLRLVVAGRLKLVRGAAVVLYVFLDEIEAADKSHRIGVACPGSGSLPGACASAGLPS